MVAARPEAVERDLVGAVVGWPFWDEVRGRVQVGSGVLAHGQAVVEGGVAVRVGLVEGPAEAGVGRVGGDVLLQRVGEVDPLVAAEQSSH
jgi:hypothetical protein